MIETLVTLRSLLKQIKETHALGILASRGALRPCLCAAWAHCCGSSAPALRAPAARK